MKVLLTCAWVGTLSEETGCTKQHRGGRILGVLPFSSLQIKDVFRGLTYTGNFKEVNCTFTRENTKELAQLSKRFLFPLHYFLRPLYQSQRAYLTARLKSRILGACKLNQRLTWHSFRTECCNVNV